MKGVLHGPVISIVTYTHVEPLDISTGLAINSYIHFALLSAGCLYT